MAAGTRWGVGVIGAVVAMGCSSPPPSPYGHDMGVGDMAVGDTAVDDMAVGDMASMDTSTVLVNTFDPDEVYLQGTFSEGACYRDAIEDFDTTTRPRAGLPCYARPPGVIRPTDGRLIYRMGTYTDDHLRVFSADHWGRTNDTFNYPDTPEENDAIVDTPECSSVLDFRIEPRSGDILYRCRDCAPGVECANVVYRSSGGTYALGPTGAVSGAEWWPGYDGIALRGDTFNLELASEDAATIPIDTDLSEFDTNPSEIRALRATPNGFRIVTLEGLYLTAFLIARDGAVTLEGTYPRWGDAYSAPFWCVLDSEGSLFCQSRRMGAGEDLVFRFDLGASSPVIVHDEADDPIVLLHISYLFSGP